MASGLITPPAFKRTGTEKGVTSPELLALVGQSFPEWRDITNLDDWLRICRGNAGTMFALVRRMDLTPEQHQPAE